MPLLSVSDFEPHYQRTFAGNDIKGMSVYTKGDGKRSAQSVKELRMSNSADLFRLSQLGLGVAIAFLSIGAPQQLVRRADLHFESALNDFSATNQSSERNAIVTIALLLKYLIQTDYFSEYF